MRQIALTQGRVALVSDEDYDELAQFSWSLMRSYGREYARRGEYIGNGQQRTELMHRRIMRAEKGIKVDHRSGDGLDNQRGNLRLATSGQITARHHRSPGLASSYRGVRWERRDQRWVAGIQVDKRHVHLGSYADEAEAARAYDRAALHHFGQFATPNFDCTSA